MHVIILATFIMCQMPKKEPVLPLMDDIPYIICDTCQKAARYLYKVVRRKQEEVKPKKVLFFELFRFSQLKLVL